MSRKHVNRPCIFLGKVIREKVDPCVQVEWQRATGHPAPFGNLRRLFRGEHCSQLDPYGTGACPYKEQECALAFLQAVRSSLRPGVRDPGGYFRSVARSTGAARADQAKDRLGDSLAHRVSEGSGDHLLADPEPVEFHRVLDAPLHSLRRPSTGPVAIGDVLRTLHLGPHQVVPTNREEGR